MTEELKQSEYAIFWDELTIKYNGTNEEPCSLIQDINAIIGENPCKDPDIPLLTMFHTLDLTLYSSGLARAIINDCLIGMLRMILM